MSYQVRAFWLVSSTTRTSPSQWPLGSPRRQVHRSRRCVGPVIGRIDAVVVHILPEHDDVLSRTLRLKNLEGALRPHHVGNSRRVAMRVRLFDGMVLGKIDFFFASPRLIGNLAVRGVGDDPFALIHSDLLASVRGFDGEESATIAFPISTNIGLAVGKTADGSRRNRRRPPLATFTAPSTPCAPWATGSTRSAETASGRVAPEVQAGGASCP